MKIIRFICILLSYSTAFANLTGPSVPFVNYLINANQTVVFPYNFGLYTSMLCYTPNFATNYFIQYTYLGHPFITKPPAILTTVPNTPNTTLADPISTVTIINTTKSGIYVSCQFGF